MLRTGGVALAVLLIVLLITVLIARSMVRPLRRLGEEDPERLANLSRVDHLVTRMRRNSENLLMLAGHEAPRRWAEPVPLVDVLRAAVSEIEQYERVVLDIQPGVAVAGTGVADTVHLLAELLENATTFSAKTTQVIVSGHGLSGGGALIDVTDSGMGVSRERLAELNDRLKHPPVADVAVSRHMGLFAVAHLAARHGIDVQLRPSPGGGTTAQVSIPASLISPDKGASGEHRAGPGRRATAVPAPRGPRYTPARLLASTPPAPARRAPDVIIPAADSPGQGGTLPIFDSVESDWFRARGRGMVRDNEPRPWTSPGDEGWRAAAAIATPSVGGMTAAGLPQRVPRANLVPGSASDQLTRAATMAESAQIALDRLANFQRGLRRARAAARTGEPAKQLTPDD